MNSVTSVVSAMALALATGCAAPRAAARIEGAADPRPMEGTVAIQTTSDSKDCKDARVCAQVEALRALLFVGVPDSPIPRAMVPNEKQAMEQHKAYFTDLIDKKGYERFVVRVQESAAGSGLRSGEKRWTIVINSDALRRSLESAGVIRRFGL